MVAQDLRCKADHLAAADAETCRFEAGDNFADESLLDGVGFEENEGALHAGMIDDVRTKIPVSQAKNPHFHPGARPVVYRHMKGVLICGGTGSRLRPLTEITNKSLLPVYDKPLILYPLQQLLEAGILEIIIISGNEHIDQMASFLGSGSRFGCHLSYRVQDKPEGIAQALGMAQEFAAGESVCAILGDNVYFDRLSDAIRNFTTGGHVFLKEVPDAQRFGVAELDSNGTVISLEEKPSQPKSKYAVTGCYVYDSRCFDIIKNLQPSARGEFEITDVSRWYMEQGQLVATVLKDEWIDAGTFESLYRAAHSVRDRRAKQLLTGMAGIVPQKEEVTNDLIFQ